MLCRVRLASPSSLQRLRSPIILRLSDPHARALSDTSGSDQSLVSRFSEKAKSTLGLSTESQRAGLRAGVEKVQEVQDKGGTISEAIQEGARSKKLTEWEEQWQARNNSMASKPEYSVADLRETLADALTQHDSMSMANKMQLKWDTWVSKGDTEESFEKAKSDIRQQIKIIDALTPSELRMPSIVRREDREIIAKELGVSQKDVHELFIKFFQVQMQWSWLRREFVKGRALPTSEEDLSVGMRDKPTPQTYKFMKMMHQNSKHQFVEEQYKDFLAEPGGRKKGKPSGRKNKSLNFN